MSHIHLPDGLVPLWLWIPAWVLALLWMTVVSKLIESRPEYRRKTPLVSIVAAFVLIAMSVEIAPLAYHVNLSILAGILLGPLLAPIAAFIVEIVLSLLGHGGITVLGINFLLLSFEMVAGWALYHGALRVVRRFMANARMSAVFSIVISTVIVLCCSTLLMLGVVYTASPNLHDLSHSHSDSEAADAVHANEEANSDEHTDKLDIFFKTVLVLAPIGWLLEALFGGAIISYIARVRPELLFTRSRRVAR